MSSRSELITAASNGDEEAFSRLLVLYDGELRRWLAGKIDVRFRSLLSEDDVLQETHMEAYTSIYSFKGDNESAFFNWLKTIARHNMLDGLKALRAARRGGVESARQMLGPDESALNLLDKLSDSGETPSARLSAREGIEILHEALGRLPERYQQVVVMYDLEGRPPDDVCAICQCSSGAMFMRRARAHSLLHDILGQDPMF